MEDDYGFCRQCSCRSSRDILPSIVCSQRPERSPLIRPTLGYLVRRGLAGPVIVTGLLIFVTSFFLITAGMLRYISSISKAVNQMAGGNLDVNPG